MRARRPLDPELVKEHVLAEAEEAGEELSDDELERRIDDVFDCHAYDCEGGGDGHDD